MADTVGKFTVSLVRNGKDYPFEQSDIIDIVMTEDIFRAAMTATLRFYDKVGSSEILEFTGYDYVIISYSEEEETYSKLFVVYDYNCIDNDIQTTGPSFNITTWYLIEPHFVNMTTYNFCRSWGENIKGSQIIKDICKNMCGIDDKYLNSFEESNETFDNFYIPSTWSPLQAINWIKNRCSGKSNLPGYLFYSNRDGLNLKTIEELSINKDREKDSKGNEVQYWLSGGVDVGDDFNHILNWSFNPPDMHSLKYLSGGLSQGYNPKSKELITKKFRYSEVIKKYSLLGKYTLFPDISNTKTDITCEGEPSEEFMTNKKEGDLIKRYVQQMAVNLEVRGHTRRYAGMLIDIVWKSAIGQKKLHGMYQGLYLVRSITHLFSNGDQRGTTANYRQIIIGLKTGYASLEQKLNIQKSEKFIEASAKTTK